MEKVHEVAILAGWGIAEATTAFVDYVLTNENYRAIFTFHLRGRLRTGWVKGHV
jgi:hypothetical protein